MKSYIKSIVIFNKNGDKRIVPLKQGVNIITGESKTGKSALVEIIDYCLCSTQCTIPKGKITDFSYLFTLIMVIGEQTYIIARYNWELGGKMFFSKENTSFDTENLDLQYFDDKTTLPYQDVKNKIESALGMFVTNTTDNNDGKCKASLRNMVSYMFQHQNLIASKFALFYRFSDFYKRKEVINQFPVFAGMVNQEYYSSLIELNSLKANLIQQKKKQKINKKSQQYVKDNLMSLLLDYYALLEMDFDKNVSLNEMLKIASNLPEFDDTILFGNKEIVKRYNELNSKLENIRNEEVVVLAKISELEKTSNNGNSYSKMLQDLKLQTESIKIETNTYTCPLCGNNCKKINENDSELMIATQWLDSELEITKKYTTDFSEDIRKLKEKHGKIEDNIRKVWKEKKLIESKYIKSKELLSKREKINYAKAKIKLYVEMNDSGIFEFADDDISKLQEEIQKLQEKLKVFDIDNKLSKAQTFISDNMNRLAESLDFEEEFKPINLNFDIINHTFDIYQSQNNKQRIYLYEMGSGANWVSCHIALFLSFLHYFALQQESPMPLIMFFDQPSQVYFPQGVGSESLTHADLVAVNSMYQTIFDEIKLIGSDSGIVPQIIIVDHVDGKNLDCENEFKNYIRCNWRDGKALI